jgi:plasmid maintenance system antidote protein VapI
MNDNKTEVIRMNIGEIHPSEIIQDELDARGWDLDDLAIRMAPKDFGVTRLALDFYFIIGPESINCRIGKEMAYQMSKAFGVSEEVFIDLENLWIETIK